MRNSGGRGKGRVRFGGGTRASGRKEERTSIIVSKRRGGGGAPSRPTVTTTERREKERVRPSLSKRGTLIWPLRHRERRQPGKDYPNLPLDSTQKENSARFRERGKPMSFGVELRKREAARYSLFLRRKEREGPVT